MLEDVRSRKHPVILGPLLVHQQKDFSSFNYFASTLVSHDRRLRNVLAFGTDGDQAIVESFAHNFPFALQLRCFIHLTRNIEDKLRSLAIPTEVAGEFIADIFGRRTGGVYIEGLVDSRSEEDFDATLKQLETVWESRPNGSKFYRFFSQYQSNVIKYHMRRDIREAAGLGNPPSIYTTNSVESINAELKRKVNYKESQWPEFNRHMQQLVESQRDEIVRAISGRGQYRLLPEFQHLSVSVNEWIKMRPEQRRISLQHFQEARLCSTPSAQKSEAASTSHLSASSQTPSRLSVSAENSGISVIPIVTLNAMWTKAEELLSTDNCITAAPGNDKKGEWFCHTVLQLLTLCEVEVGDNIIVIALAFTGSQPTFAAILLQSLRSITNSMHFFVGIQGLG